MSVTLSPTSPPTFPGSLTAPADGDALSAASNNGPDQNLLDGVTAARLMLYSGLSMRPRLRSINGTSVVMGAVPAMAVTTGGVWTVKAPVPAQTFVAGDIDVGGAFLASTIYYMYLKLVGGTITRVISTTVPDAYNRYRTDSTDYAYVGSFTVSATPLVNAFSACGGRYFYLYSLGLRKTFTGSGAGPFTLNFRTDPVALPASSSLVYLDLIASYINANTGDTTLSFGPLDGSNADGYRKSVNLHSKYEDGAGAAQQSADSGDPFPVETDSSGRVTVSVTGSNTTSYAAAASVNGYLEW